MTRIPRSTSDAVAALENIEAAAHRLLAASPGIKALIERLHSDASTGLRAASYDESGPGTHSDEFGALPDHADPTGNAAVQNGARPDALTAVMRAIGAAEAAMHEVSCAHEKHIVKAKVMVPTRDEAGPGDMWCRSCWRLGEHEPIDPDAPKKRLCRWCAEKAATAGFPLGADGWPVVELVRVSRSKYGRRYLTTRDLETYLAGVR